MDSFPISLAMHHDQGNLEKEGVMLNLQLQRDKSASWQDTLWQPAVTMATEQPLKALLSNPKQGSREYT